MKTYFAIAVLWFNLFAVSRPVDAAKAILPHLVKQIQPAVVTVVTYDMNRSSLSAVPLVPNRR